MDAFFTAVFTFEMLLNLYAGWFAPFFNDGWYGSGGGGNKIII